MKFSEQWLRGWVSPQVSRDELVARLSMAGLEVDSVTPAAGVFNGVVVGEVLSTEQHLTLTSCACARSAMVPKPSRSCAERQTCARA